MRTRLFIISVLSLLVFSCTDEKQNVDIIPPIVNGSESFTVQALLETKTSIEGFRTSWVDGDALSIFHNGSSDGKFDLTDAASGSFKGQLASPLESSNDWIAVYPYSDASLNAYPITIATEQRQSSSSSTAHLAGVSVPLCGKTEAVASDANPVFQMHHLASFVKITVKNTRWYETEINDVELVLEDAALSGDFNVNLSSATMSPVSSQSKVKITLDTPAVIDMAGEVVFYAAIAPLTLPAGKSISLYVNGDLAKNTVFENDITFAPGKVKSISAEYGVAVVVNGVKLEKGVKSFGNGVDLNCYSAEISFERAQAVEISGIYQREINRDFFDTANFNTFCAESGTYKVEYYPDYAYMWLYNASQTYPACLYILGDGKFAAPKFDDWLSWKLDGWLRDTPMMVVAPKVSENTYKATMSMSTNNTNWRVLLELYSDLSWNGVIPVSLTGDAAARFSLVDNRIKGVDEKTDPFVPGNYEFTFTVAEGGLAVSVQKID